MLVTMKEILNDANKNNYAVPAPNVGGEREARAAIEAAEENRSPLILDVSYRNHTDLPFFGSYLRQLAGQSFVPIAINLDHGAATPEGRYREPMMAIRAGFTSLMVDRSSWEYEANVAEVQLIAEFAHSVGMSVEAELGHVGQGANYNQDPTLAFTDPDQALDYITRTKIDCLAISIGTAHGAYAGEPKLDFERLRAIKEKTNGFPLVLHGGSGTGDGNLHKASQMGINKINVSNELMAAAARAVQALDLSGNGAYKVWTTAIGGWKDRLSFLLRNFGCAGKAWEVKPSGLGTAKVEFIELD